MPDFSKYHSNHLNTLNKFIEVSEYFFEIINTLLNKLISYHFF